MLSALRNKWVLIVTGTLAWSLTMVKSGLLTSYGISFWGPNGHDALWHMSLISGLSRGSLEMPVFAGTGIHNYHLGFDLALAVIHLLTRIPVSWLYFQILPPLLAFAIGFLTYKLVFSWQKSKIAAWWSTFFVYFGGSLGWLLTLLRGQGWGGESMFWSQQSISTLLNPPFALSLILILLGLNFLGSRRIWPAVIFFGLTGFVKIYAGIICLSGLFFLALYEFINNYKNNKSLINKSQKNAPQNSKSNFYIKIFLGSLIINLLLFLPLNYKSSGLLVFQPFWFLETMMAYPDRLGWARYYQAMTAYKSGFVWYKLFPAYFIALFIFLIGNLGTRILVLLHLPKKIGVWEMFFYPGLVVGILFPLIFVQSGTPWNPIQFFYYVQFYLALLIGPVLAKFRSKILYLIVILITIPTTLIAFPNYLPSRPPAAIPPAEISALQFLTRQAPGTILTPPAHPNPYASAPRPLYLYDSTAYVSAYANHPVYLEDEVNLSITGYPWEHRRKMLDNFFTTTDPVAAKKFLSENNIRYIYLPDVLLASPALGPQAFGFKVLYENYSVSIWSRL